jgi:hypothetical protein
MKFSVSEIEEIHGQNSKHRNKLWSIVIQVNNKKICFSACYKGGKKCIAKY